MENISMDENKSAGCAIVTEFTLDYENDPAVISLTATLPRSEVQKRIDDMRHSSGFPNLPCPVNPAKVAEQALYELLVLRAE